MAQTLADLVTTTLADDFDRATWLGQCRQALLDGAGRAGRTGFLAVNEVEKTIVTAVSVNSYSMPSYTRLRSVFIGDDELEPTSKEIIDAQPDTPTAKPTMFTLYGNKILVYPTPNAVLTLKLNLLQSSATINDSDSVAAILGVPEDYLYVLVAYARSVLYGMTDDFEASQYWEGVWDRGRAEMKGTLAYRLQRRRRVPGISQSRWTGPVFRRP